MQKVLAFDVGGSSTRAVLVDETGRCRGYGQSTGGNPVSHGPDAAAKALAQAAAGAVWTAAGAVGTAAGAVDAVVDAGAGSDGSGRADSGRVDSERAGAGGVPVDRMLIAAAGVAADIDPSGFVAGLAGIVEPRTVGLRADVLAAYYSGCTAEAGAVLVAGTGAVAARVTGGELDRVVDGCGWLIGDAGSGFWIGRRVVRAAVASLEGRAPATALGRLFLRECGFEDFSRTAVIQHAYAMPPVALARFAPLASAAAADGDRVAAGILDEAADRLVDSLEAVRGDRRDPVVLSGGLLSGGPDDFGDSGDSGDSGGSGGSGGAPVGAAVRERLAGSDVRVVGDGVVGAACLGLRDLGVTIDAALQKRVATGVAAMRYDD